MDTPTDGLFEMVSMSMKNRDVLEIHKFVNQLKDIIAYNIIIIFHHYHIPNIYKIRY